MLFKIIANNLKQANVKSLKRKQIKGTNPQYSDMGITRKTIQSYLKAITFCYNSANNKDILCNHTIYINDNSKLFKKNIPTMVLPLICVSRQAKVYRHLNRAINYPQCALQLIYSVSILVSRLYI